MQRNKQKLTPIPPWQTTTVDGRERTYFRMGISFLDHLAVLNLSEGAFKTYCYMLQAAKGNREFIYPKSKYLKICGTEAFARRKKELIIKGFIEIKEKWDHVAGKATVYEFSEQWKTKYPAAAAKRERAAPKAP